MANRKPMSRSRTAASPRSHRSCRGGGEEIDARGLLVLPGRHRRPRPFQRAGAHRVGRRGHRQPRAGGRRRRGVLRHAAQLHAVHRERPRGRRETGGARSGVDHRLRAVGRARAGLGARDGRDGRERRGRLQGVHVRLGPAGVSPRRRHDAARRDARGRAARAAGGRARRERGDDRRGWRSRRPARTARAFLDVAAGRGRGRGDRARAPARRGSRTRRSTSCTSARAVAWRRPPRRRRGAWTCRSRPARTICSSSTRISNAWARWPSARRRCGARPTRRRCGTRSRPGRSTSSPPTTPPRCRR